MPDSSPHSILTDFADIRFALGAAHHGNFDGKMREEAEAALARIEEELERWHSEALDWQQAKSEADSAYEDLEEQLEAERKAWRTALDSALQYVPLKDHDFIEAIVSNPASEPERKRKPWSRHWGDEA